MLDKILENQIKNDDIFHSYIFEGNEFLTEKLYTEFVQKLLRTKININSLVEIIRPENNNISIEKIRELTKKVYEKPVGYRYKIFVIENADKMRIESQNAILKTLEEMPDFSIVIMNVDNRYKLLDTIISRSQVFSTFRHYDFDYDDEIVSKTIDLISKSLEKNYYIINKEKTLIKDLSEEKIKTLQVMTKIFSDALTIDYRQIENLRYRKVIEKLKKISFSNLENIIVKLEKLKTMIKVNINFQMAIEDLIFNIIESSKKRSA